MKIKGQRVSSEIQKEISNIILTEAKDEDFKFITITHVNCTNDLSFAKIYFTTLNDSKKEKVLHDLNKAVGFFRSLLAEKLNVRHTPELRFVYDDSIEYAKKIENIIDKIKEENI